MRIRIPYGRTHLDLDVPEEHLVGGNSPPPTPAVDPWTAVREALETPHHFPPLRRALTPDDHVAVVVDEELPHLAEMLKPVLEHITGAGISPKAITLLCPPSSSSQEWLEGLPDKFQDVRVEMHDPMERRKLAYLATTSKGRRIYFNRTAVDADQLVVLARRGYDPLLGYSGSEGALYPAFSDEATRRELACPLSLAAPEERSWPVRKEAAEVAWLLGAPFMVQVIEGPDEQVAGVVAGLIDSDQEGQRLLNACWRIEVDQPADVVLASVSGDPARHTFTDLARALATASRVVKPGGRIILLSEANPPLGPGADILRQEEDAGGALAELREKQPPDMAAAFLWAHAAQQAQIYALTGLPGDVVEEMFAFPLDDAGQVQRLLKEGTCLVLPDAHKTLALVGQEARHHV